MKTVLIAGATGYLGRYVAQTFQQDGYRVRALVRNEQKLAQPGAGLAPAVRDCIDEIHIGDVTQPATLKGIAEGVDVVFSSISLMGQTGRLTWHDVDYLGNVNILNEALAAGVRKFVFISVFDAQAVREIPIVKAHEDFAKALAASGLEYTIIRPTGFFSDMGEFLTMAQSGRVYLLGDGETALNPIHGSDLARVCVDAAADHRTEINAGGPQTYTWNEVAALAFAAAHKSPHVTRLPLSLARFGVRLAHVVKPQTADLWKFFVEGAAQNHVAPAYGTHRLEEHFADIVRQEG